MAASPDYLLVWLLRLLGLLHQLNAKRASSRTMTCSALLTLLISIFAWCGPWPLGDRLPLAIID